MKNKSLPFNQVKTIHRGMIIRSFEGREYCITDILDLNKKSHNSILKPNDCSIILELDNRLYLSTDIGWEHMSDDILIMNALDYVN